MMGTTTAAVSADPTEHEAWAGIVGGRASCTPGALCVPDCMAANGWCPYCRALLAMADIADAIGRDHDDRTWHTTWAPFDALWAPILAGRAGGEG